MSLLDSSLPVIPLSCRHNPLIWFPNLTSLVTSFRLRRISDNLELIGSEASTHRHTPGADRIDITLRLSSSTTVRMISYKMSVSLGRLG